jgi:alpha-ketoglutarate-dependent taurine dioxygenase
MSSLLSSALIGTLSRVEFAAPLNCRQRMREPPAISTLYAVEVPPFGGDTIWANSALAYAMLSERMRELIGGLRLHMSMRDVLKSAQENAEQRDSPIGRLAATRSEPLSAELAAKVTGTFHPLVRTHPVTGEKALYCDSSYAIGIEGLRPEESAPILRFLAEHITQPAFTCRLRWEPKTLNGSFLVDVGAQVLQAGVGHQRDHSCASSEPSRHLDRGDDVCSR